jgi:hypothetical protein
MLKTIADASYQGLGKSECLSLDWASGYANLYIILKVILQATGLLSNLVEVYVNK